MVDMAKVVSLHPQDFLYSQVTDLGWHHSLQACLISVLGNTNNEDVLGVFWTSLYQLYDVPR